MSNTTRPILPEERGWDRAEFDRMIMEFEERGIAQVIPDKKVASAFVYKLTFLFENGRTLVISLELKDYQSDSDVTITNISTLPVVARRREDVGRRGIKQLVEWSRKHGFNEIRAAQVQSDSVEFWVTMGFERCRDPNPTNDYVLRLQSRPVT